MNLLEKMEAAGVEIKSHESDMLVPVTKESEGVLKDYRYRANVTTFTNNQTGDLWFDIPFEFTPYWKNKAAKKR